LQVANQIEQALLTLDTAQKREISADTGVVSAAEAVRATQVGYQAGARTALEVTDAQAALLAAQTDAVNARFDVATAQSRLAAAVGVLTGEGQTAYQRALAEEEQAIRARDAKVVPVKNDKKKNGRR
jgi:outer membrane protein